VTKAKRGLALVDPEKRREIARKGGLATSASGNGRRFTPEEAKVAGAKGGRINANVPGRMRDIARKPRKKQEPKEESEST